MSARCPALAGSATTGSTGVETSFGAAVPFVGAGCSVCVGCGETPSAAGVGLLAAGAGWAGAGCVGAAAEGGTGWTAGALGVSAGDCAGCIVSVAGAGAGWIWVSDAD
ncbi:UNVERIFIED_ORG: hypothetical protein J2S29_001569 [Rhizobium sp. SLBN-170]